jgi:hypothetical protein
LLCPGGVRPAGFVGADDVAEPVADAVPEPVARGVALPDEAGTEPADGEGDSARPGPNGDGLAVLRTGAPAPPSLCATAAGARGAAHSVNGAAGPPAIATTTAPRQSASASPDMAPIRRMTRRRRPDGSAKTGLECTAGV